MTRWSGWACLAMAIATGAAWVAATGHAQAPTTADPPNVVQAREHLNRGTQLLDQANYDGALVEFQRAYDLIPAEHPARPLILFNIARANERLFRYDVALDYYHRFLADAAPDAPQRAEVQGTIGTLEGFLGTLDIQTNVPAEVWVDDRQVGTAPGTVRVPGGRHVVRVHADGHQDGQREVQVAARETQTVSFTLSALASEYRGISSVFFWGASGLALGAALAGGGVGIAAISRRGNVNAQLMDPVRSLDGGSLEAARREIQTFALVADVLFGTAGVFVITAVVLAFLTDWGGAPSTERAALHVLPFAGPDVAGLSLGGSF